MSFDLGPWLGDLGSRLGAYAPLDIWLVVENLPLFARGLGNTVLLLSGSLLIGTVAAIPLALARARRVRILGPIVFGYTYVFRGTPLLVQLYLLYYGAAQFDLVRQSFLWVVLREAWWCALISFSICSCAYLTEIFRGAIEAVPEGEVDAARALGLNGPLTLLLVVLPSAARRALPAFSNETIFALHATALASTVTIVDILGAARQFNNKYYLGMDGSIVAAALYIVLAWVISVGFRQWEARWYRHLA